MNSITACSDPRNDNSMNAISRHVYEDPLRRRFLKFEAAAYLLAVIAHIAVWQIYKSMPPPPPMEEPPIIEASLIVAPPAPVAVAPVAPPRVEPPPPKPQPKPKVVEKPKPKPKPTPTPRPATHEPEPTPAEDSAPAETAPAPAVAPRAAAPAGTAQNTQYHAGSMSGLRKRYPRAALERGWEGTVTLRVHILADGDIGEVLVVSSSGHEVLDEQAVELIKEAHATPARKGDSPIDSWVVVPYQFKIEHN